MAMVLGKTELVEHKDAENRGLARRMEQLQKQLRNSETSWKKVFHEFPHLSIPEKYILHRKGSVF